MWFSMGFPVFFRNPRGLLHAKPGSFGVSVLQVISRFKLGRATRSGLLKNLAEKVRSVVSVLGER